jgi:hypothetical protein
MGTRGLTVVEQEGGAEIAVLYRQYDSYPRGHGKELAEFLAPNGVEKTLVNGYSSRDQHAFNGMGCLAAQLVAHFKKEIGGFYLYAPGSRDVGEEYVYTLYELGGRVMVRVETTYPDKEAGESPILFSGNVAEFVAWIAAKEKE